MYLPILRGKQYELLALRELSKEQSSNEFIWPIIEPVATDFNSLETACEALANSKFNFVLVVNPIVGKIKNPEHILRFITKTPCLRNNSNLIIGIQSLDESKLDFTLGLLNENKLNDRPIAVIHNDLISESFYQNLIGKYNIKLNLLHEKIKSRRFKHMFDPATRVILDDVFITQQKNADYTKQVDELFTDIHLIYKDEHYIGFSDYLTIGEQFTDGGFLPFAVAIHLTYDAGESIRIRHFVSDSNDDYHDTPGKFLEALNKLVEFTSSLKYKTKAVKTFEEFHKKGHYPGLGTIKKLSMLNHLELITHLLSK
jgi:hypothetical protein